MKELLSEPLRDDDMRSTKEISHFDTIISNGLVFNVTDKQYFNGDIGIVDGIIVEIGNNLDASQADDFIDAKGNLILPGFVDFHAHCYWGGTALGINPSKVGPATGVTTFVDLGSTGAGNFEGFNEHVIKLSSVSIYAFLNLSYIGLSSIGDTEARFGELFDDRLMDVHSINKAISRYRDIIKGIKIRLGPSTSGKNGYFALNIATQLASELNLPLVVHATSPPPFLDEILGALKSGDVFTHCFNQDPFLRIVGANGSIKPAVLDARARGVLFDVGHGVSCFSYEMAKICLDNGFPPDIISSDLHAYNINGPVFDLPTTLSKFIALGMSTEDVFYRATLAPAKAIGMDHVIGSLEQGKRADIVIARWSERKQEMWDSHQLSMKSEHLNIVATFSAGTRLQPYTDERTEAKWKPGIPVMYRKSEPTL